MGRTGRQASQDGPHPDPLPGGEGTGQVALTAFESSPGFLVDQTDLKLQTALPAEELQSRLLATYYAARTSLEEQGVNTLFLALGMLRWSEPDDAPGGSSRRR